jgi:GH15 family glucan-1,4-alpha-glucosidase
MRLPPELSVEIIRGSQTATGAYPASPAHEVYRYGWLRDGSWCAQAMDRAGHRASAGAWHRWVAEVLLRHERRVEEALDAARGGTVDGRVMLPARFTLEGEEEAAGGEEWPNFQLDCYGHWLWAVADHVERGGELESPMEAAARLVIRYLMGAAQLACYDCWEEHPGQRHTSTLASVVAGLRDAGSLLGDRDAQAYAGTLRGQMLGPDHTLGGSLVRSVGDTRVDGSLVWVFIPYRIVPLDADLAATTIGRVRDELQLTSGGVRRYQGDTFFGGAEWILLAASLGCVSVAQGDNRLAEGLLNWIEGTATADGFLPEQVTDNVQSPHMLRYWQQRWGQTACPLLWSHAMHLILLDDLGRLSPCRATG